MNVMRRLPLLSGLIVLLLALWSAGLITAQQTPATPGSLTPTPETMLPTGTAQAAVEATAKATLAVTPESTPAAPVEDVLYTVVRGDRLIKIAERYGVSLECLVRVNRLSNPNRILVGQMLLIPVSCQSGQGGAAEIPAAAPGMTASVTSEGITGHGLCQFDRYPGRFAPGGVYTIRAGDTLDFIACDFGIALSCLLDTNPQIGANRGRIHAGDEITISLSCPGWEGAVIP